MGSVQSGNNRTIKIDQYVVGTVGFEKCAQVDKQARGFDWLFAGRNNA